MEFDIIHRYFKQPGTGGTVLGIGDDAAILAPKGDFELAVSADTLVCGQHFFEDADPYKLGYKSLSVNLSDMAAMGARPRWATLLLTLPKNLVKSNEVWLSEFARGFHELGQRSCVALIGGDTTCGPLNIGVQVIGEAQKGQFLRRDGAKAGDDIWVSGYLGDAALALKHELHEINLTGSEAEYCRSALHMPTARIELGQHLVGLAHSAIDISDGLLADLEHILTRSKQGAIVWFESLPCSAVMKKHKSSALAQQCLLAGGDDYEICFTAPSINRSAIEQIAHKLQIPLTRIGETNKSEGLLVMDASGRTMEIEKKGYDHFTF